MTTLTNKPYHQMLETKGIIESIDVRSVRAVFVVNYKQYVFTVNVNPAVAHFRGSATMKWSADVGQLTGSHNMSGKIQGPVVWFAASNGVQIISNDGPPDDRSLQVVGSGSWSTA